MPQGSRFPNSFYPPEMSPVFVVCEVCVNNPDMCQTDGPGHARSAPASVMRIVGHPPLLGCPAGAWRLSELCELRIRPTLYFPEFRQARSIHSWLAFSGRVTLTWVPFPTVLSSRTVPCMATTACRTIDRPSPVPRDGPVRARST